MAITYDVKVESDYLLVTSSGFDENLNDTMNYVRSLIDKVKELKCYRVICDERDVKYNLGITDTFRLAEYLADQIKGVGKLALLYNPIYLQEVQFWETVSLNRGVRVKIFQFFQDAQRWIKE